MKLQKLFITLIALVMVTGMVLLAASALQAQAADEDSELIMYIGHVTDNEDEFVGIAIQGEEAVLYICDGKPEEGTVSILQWYVGTVVDNVFDVTHSTGNRVELTIDGESAAGHFTFTDGTIKEFELAQAGQESGLFRSEFTLGDVNYVAGWLVLEDGSTRGGIVNQETGELSPASLISFAAKKKAE